jgi:hypothetical protein
MGSSGEFAVGGNGDSGRQSKGRIGMGLQHRITFFSRWQGGDSQLVLRILHFFSGYIANGNSALKEIDLRAAVSAVRAMNASEGLCGEEERLRWG